jgi:hypothetical protein
LVLLLIPGIVMVTLGLLAAATPLIAALGKADTPAEIA